MQFYLFVTIPHQNAVPPSVNRSAGNTAAAHLAPLLHHNPPPSLGTGRRRPAVPDVPPAGDAESPVAAGNPRHRLYRSGAGTTGVRQRWPDVREPPAAGVYRTVTAGWGEDVGR